MSCGFVRIPRDELNAWAMSPDRKARVTFLDESEGGVSHAHSGNYGPRAAKSTDGRLWFTHFDGVSVIDPRYLPFNRVPPPVYIEQVIAGHKVASGPRLPALTRELQIDYTALSLVAPEKNRFRYKLEGHDTEWTEAGNRRQAFYNDLKPRSYRFRVQASNNSGVWNEAGAFLDFSVAPAYYQTIWFEAACVAAFLALLAVLYRLRLAQVARQFNMRFEERVNERTRIARDLHDTLLQSFQGVLLKFHAITYMMPDRSQAQERLNAAIEEAREAIAEGRDAVQGLRASAIATEDIARAITTFGEGLVPGGDGHAPRFHVHVEGAPRDLAPVVRDEIYRIAGEGLRNAFRHSGARRIEVDIHYDKRQLCLRVRDNGKGIDPRVLDAGGSAGHHGLPGMQERAKLVGGKLAIWSELESGTEIELSVSAAIAYAKSPVARPAGQKT
jgi:signal transduction histidine kinase